MNWKKVVLFLCCCVCGILGAAKPLAITGSEIHRAKEIGAVAPFHTLFVNGQIEVDFRQGSAGEYTVSAYGPDNLLNWLDIKSTQDTLFVRYKQPLRVLGDHQVRVLVTAPDVKQIEVREQGEVNMALPVELVELNLVADGKGEIDLEQVKADFMRVQIQADAEVDIGQLTCQSLHIETDGGATFDVQRADCNTIMALADNRSHITLSALSGNTLTAQSNHAAHIELKGKSSRADLAARGRSSIEAGALQADKADVMAANGSFIEVRVSDTLNAQTESRGVVKYRGWPKEINRSGKGLVRKNA